jgi:hypothetical protein
LADIGRVEVPDGKVERERKGAGGRGGARGWGKIARHDNRYAEFIVDEMRWLKWAISDERKTERLVEAA